MSTGWSDDDKIFFQPRNISNPTQNEKKLVLHSEDTSRSTIEVPKIDTDQKIYYYDTSRAGRRPTIEKRKLTGYAIVNVRT